MHCMLWRVDLPVSGEPALATFDLPQRLEPRDWQRVDVLTCAAPDLREQTYNAMSPGQGGALHLSDRELLDIHLSRGRQILRIAVHHGAEAVILGAFGCGAFRNPPEVVARAYRALMDEFDGQFRAIEFAVYCPFWDTTNYDAFARSGLSRGEKTACRNAASMV